ncbi:MAG: phosphatase PAP2 family protein [Bacteroidetes bacterium]|nr:phosphatase PAP2 family protein [Bacteroidota bacterium]
MILLNSMAQTITYWDAAAFHYVNSEIASPVLDWLMPIIRNPLIWLPLYVFFGALLICNFKQKGFFIIGFAVLAFIISDQLSAHLIKPWVGRLRPCNSLADFRMLVPCGSGFSFPSTHATNHFMISVFLITVLGKHLPKLPSYLIVWAGLVSFAQVYVALLKHSINPQKNIKT